MRKIVVRHICHNGKPICGGAKHWKNPSESGNVLCKKCLLAKAKQEAKEVNEAIMFFQSILDKE